MRIGCLFLLATIALADTPVTPVERDAAIVKALKYLDEELWKLQEGGSPRRQYTFAVAGYAYLLAAEKGDGKKLPGRSRQIKRIRDELTRYAKRVSDLYRRDDKKKKKAKPPPRGFGPGMMTSQYVWPLGAASLFFAESAARGKSKGPSQKTLKSIAKVMIAAQQPNGGWGHDDAARPGMGLPPIRIPKPGGGQIEYPPTLLAASSLALSAIGFARVKDKGAREKGRAFFEQAQNGDGTFPYDPSQKHAVAGATAMAGGIEVARTSGAVLALLWAGAKRDDPVVVKALAAIDKHPELVGEGHGSAAMALQLSALLARARGDRAWKTFRDLHFRKILAKQEKSGAFLCICSDKPGVTNDTRSIPGMPMGDAWAREGKVYVTAIHTMILLLDRAKPRGLPEAPGPKGPTTQDQK